MPIAARGERPDTCTQADRDIEGSMAGMLIWWPGPPYFRILISLCYINQPAPRNAPASKSKMPGITPPHRDDVSQT